MFSKVKSTIKKYKLIEKNTNGPIRKVCIQSTQICAVALQDEQYMWFISYQQEF